MSSVDRLESTSSEMMLLRQATPFVGSLGPASFRRWIVERLPLQCLKNIIHISDTLHLRSSEIFQIKKRFLEADKADATDIMSILRKPRIVFLYHLTTLD